jgi:hypothetical protein
MWRQCIVHMKTEYRTAHMETSLLGMLYVP